jgi:hypothetical protein
MSVAVTGAGVPATHGGPMAPDSQGDGDGPRARGGPGRWRSRLTLRTTPGRLRLALIALVAASLAWGALAGFTVSQYSSAATSVVTTSEPLTLDAQQIYHDLSDANDTAATAFLDGGLQPFSLVSRYQADVNAASHAIEQATALGGGSPDLVTLSENLPVYTGEIETARADNRLGYPLGAAYLHEASNLMNGTLLPAAQRLYTADNSRLTATSAQATGLPLVLVTIVAGLAIGYALYRTSRWLTRRTNRVLNAGLLAAGLAGVVSLVWLAVAFIGAHSDLLTAQSRGSVPVQALARADIVALQAHADESLTLIDNTGDDQYQTDYVARQKALGPGAGSLLAAATSAAAGSPAASSVSAAAAHAGAWNAAHVKLRAADDSGNHSAAVASALGTGPGDAGGGFAAFSAAMTSGINADQAAFAASASAGGNMYGGLEAATIVLALAMAAGCGWGLSRRLVEYR